MAYINLGDFENWQNTYTPPLGFPASEFNDFEVWQSTYIPPLIFNEQSIIPSIPNKVINILQAINRSNTY